MLLTGKRNNGSADVFGIPCFKDKVAKYSVPVLYTHTYCLGRCHMLAQSYCSWGSQFPFESRGEGVLACVFVASSHVQLTPCPRLNASIRMVMDLGSVITLPFDEYISQYCS